MQIKKLIFASSYIGQAGICIILLSALIAAASYVGKQNETYSFLNHFISELGEIGVSPLAHIFNGGLILGGLLTSFFMLGLATHISGNWGLGIRSNWLGNRHICDPCRNISYESIGNSYPSSKHFFLRGVTDGSCL